MAQLVTGALLYGAALAICFAMLDAYRRVTRVPRWRRVWQARRRQLQKDAVALAKGRRL